jgi:hypothetical protein
MHDGVGARVRDGRSEPGRVEEVHLGVFGAGGDRGAVAATQIVDDNDLVTALADLLGGSHASDVAGAAGDEDPGHGSGVYNRSMGRRRFRRA